MLRPQRIPLSLITLCKKLTQAIPLVIRTNLTHRLRELPLLRLLVDMAQGMHFLIFCFFSTHTFAYSFCLFLFYLTNRCSSFFFSLLGAPTQQRRQRLVRPSVAAAGPTRRQQPQQPTSVWSQMRHVPLKEDKGSPSLHGRASGSPFLGGSSLAAPMSELSLAGRTTSDTKVSRFSSLSSTTVKSSYSLSSATAPTSFAQVQETTSTFANPSAATVASVSASNIWQARRIERETQEKQLEEKREQEIKKQAFLSELTTVENPPVPMLDKANDDDEDFDKRIARDIEETPFRSSFAIKFYRDPDSHEILFVKDANSSRAKLWNEKEEAEREQERRRLEERLRKEREAEEKRKLESEAKRLEEERKAAEEEEKRRVEEEKRRKEQEEKEKELEREKETTQTKVIAPTPGAPVAATTATATLGTAFPTFPDPVHAAAFARTPQGVPPHFTSEMAQSHSFDASQFSQNSSELNQSYYLSQYAQMPHGVGQFYLPGYNFPMAMPYYYPHMYSTAAYGRDMPVAQGDYNMHQTANRNATGVTGDSSNADPKRPKNPQQQPFIRPHVPTAGMPAMPSYMAGYPVATVPGHLPSMLPVAGRHTQPTNYRDFPQNDMGRLQKTQGTRPFNPSIGSMHGTDNTGYGKSSYIPKHQMGAYSPQMNRPNYPAPKVPFSPLQNTAAPFKPDLASTQTSTAHAVPTVPEASGSPVTSTQSSGNESHVQ